MREEIDKDTAWIMVKVTSWLVFKVFIMRILASCRKKVFQNLVSLTRTLCHLLQRYEEFIGGLRVR